MAKTLASIGKMRLIVKGKDKFDKYRMNGAGRLLRLPETLVVKEMQTTVSESFNPVGIVVMSKMRRSSEIRYRLACRRNQ